MFASVNTTHFALHIPSVRNNFKLLAFHGSEALSYFTLSRLCSSASPPNFDLESLLSKPAFLWFTVSGEVVRDRIEDAASPILALPFGALHLLSMRLDSDEGVHLDKYPSY